MCRYRQKKIDDGLMISLILRTFSLDCVLYNVRINLMMDSLGAKRRGLMHTSTFFMMILLHPLFFLSILILMFTFNDRSVPLTCRITGSRTMNR